jgi:glyceraldehyde-3-phosphate dehydrogenase (NADP+)
MPSADIAAAAATAVTARVNNNGQSCIAGKRFIVHTDVYDQFMTEFRARMTGLVVGDPLDEATDVGPVINRSEAERVEEWLAEATQGGARILTGGERDGALFQPTVIAGAEATAKVSCEELFAPVVGVYDYSDPSDAIARAGSSDFGLQAGIFTNDMRIIAEAFDRIEVGGLNVNDVPTFRIDHMPYGGVKQSGFGREGLRYAIEENTEMKLLTINERPLAP